jgi:Cu+-exporting ATPase
MNTTESNAAKTTTIQAQGMNCRKCAGRVKAALSAEPGVLDVSVDLQTQQVTVQSDASAAPDFAGAVRRAGYGVLGIE